MKKLFVFLFFIPSMLMAQHFTGLVDVSNKTSDQLYGAAKQWFVDNIKSYND